MNLYGKKVVLRALEPEDMEVLREIINDPEIERLIGGWSFPVSNAKQQNWYSIIANDNKSIRFAIETEEDGVIGMADLRDIDWKNRSAFHGIKIGNKKYRGRGYGKDVVLTVMKYAFEELQLNRLDGTIIEYNEGSKKLYLEKCGWQIEGIQRKYIFKGNKYHNQLIVGILSEEYFELINKNGYWNE